MRAYLGQLFENGEDLFKNSIDMVGHGLKPGSLAGNFKASLVKLILRIMMIKNQEALFIVSSRIRRPIFFTFRKIITLAIQIPEEFQYGNGSKSPVILVPGTGSKGGMTYAANYAKLLNGFC